MSKAVHTFKLNAYELARRAGEMKEYQLDITVDEKIGVDLIAVPAGELIEVDARLESVTEGVLLTADVYAIAKGECIRCLDPIEIVVERKIQELYNYPPEDGKGKKKKKQENYDDLDVEDELMMEGDVLDLEPPIRDAIVLSLPINPLCTQDCLGLCPECGVKWSELPGDHMHQLKDARWASLESLNLEDPDFKI